MSDFLLASEGLCLTSSDGINWFQVAGSVPWVNCDKNGVCWNGSIFCAIAKIYPDTYAWTSTDGVAWIQRNLPDSTSEWFAIAWNGTIFAVTTTDGSQAATSPDGITWTARTTPYNQAYRFLAYGGGVFCGVGGYGDKGMISADGITWTETTLPPGSKSRLVYGSGLFCAVGSDSSDVWRVLTSPDGITWTERYTDGTTLEDLTYGAGIFCGLVSETNNAMTSADGITWTARTLPATGAWNNIAWNGSIFLASQNLDIGYATSPDGITWTAGTFPIEPRLIITGEVRAAFTAIPEIGQLNLTGLDPVFNFHTFNEAPLTGTIELTGLQPQHSNYIFFGHPLTGQIAFEGLQPTYTYIPYFTAAARQGRILESGLQPNFVNRLLYPIENHWISTHYRCYLTGSQDNLIDLELLISSFQTRMAATPRPRAYLSVIVPGVDSYIDAINSRPHGRLKIDRIYNYLDGSTATFSMVNVPFETIATSQGGRAGTTGNLTGSEEGVYLTPQTIELFDPVTRSYDSGGIRYRCRLDPRVRPNDTVIINDESFVVESVIHIIDTQTAIMEVGEKH